MTHHPHSRPTPGKPPSPHDENEEHERFHERWAFIERLEHWAEAIDRVRFRVRFSILAAKDWLERYPIYGVPVIVFLVLTPALALDCGKDMPDPMGSMLSALGLVFGCITTILFIICWKH